MSTAAAPAAAPAPAPKATAIPGEEAGLGKAYDLELLRKLWPFVRPHWKMLVAWALFMPITIDTTTVTQADQVERIVALARATRDRLKRPL